MRMRYLKRKRVTITKSRITTLITKYEDIPKGKEDHHTFLEMELLTIDVDIINVSRTGQLSYSMLCYVINSRSFNLEKEGDVVMCDVMRARVSYITRGGRRRRFYNTGQ